MYYTSLASPCYPTVVLCGEHARQVGPPLCYLIGVLRTDWWWSVPTARRPAWPDGGCCTRQPRGTFLPAPSLIYMCICISFSLSRTQLQMKKRSGAAVGDSRRQAAPGAAARVQTRRSRQLSPKRRVSGTFVDCAGPDCVCGVGQWLPSDRGCGVVSSALRDVFPRYPVTFSSKPDHRLPASDDRAFHRCSGTCLCGRHSL